MDIPTIALAVVAVIAALAGVTGFYGKTRGETVISLLKEEIDHYIRENSQLKEENASNAAANDRLLIENKRLVTLAQGSPQLKKLTAVVEKQAKMAQDLAKQVKGLLEREK